MTVSTTTNKIVLTANGATNVFSFPFAVRSGGQTDIQVFTTDTSGTITQLTQPSQYSVTLNAAIAPNPTPVGGSVNLVSIPANGVLVTILRTMALTQPTSLANQGNLYQPVLESTDDNQEMQVQQVSELQGRAIVVAVSDSAPPALPPAAQRASKALVFDSSGNPTAGVIPASGVISSAMAPFVSAVSIAAAKALLGYGTMANENIGAAGKGIADDGAGNARVSHTISSVAVNQSPTSANHMTDYISSGTLIFTLPKLTTVFNGYELWIFCLTNTATLTPNAADNFPTLGGGVSIVLTAGQWARIIGDGTSAWLISIGKIPGIGGATVTTLTSGSGNYTTKAGCTRLRIRAVGGGGSGGGKNGGAAGGNGGDTSFNSIVAKGGSGPAAGTPAGGGPGGAGGTGGTGSASIRIPGSAGTTGLGVQIGGTSTIGVLPPGVGGMGLLGGGGGTGQVDSAISGASGCSGGGGGAGEYIEFPIGGVLAATYAYVVGAAGTGGGGNGQPGFIVIEEFYN